MSHEWTVDTCIDHDCYDCKLNDDEHDCKQEDCIACEECHWVPKDEPNNSEE